jgi:hypothetical protein
VPDKYRAFRPISADLSNVGVIVSQSPDVDFFTAVAFPVSSEAEGMNVKSMSTKVRQEILIPAPCSMKASMHEYSWRIPT